MEAHHKTWLKQEALLPADKPRDNPLFIVLAILAFLATLSLLSLKVSYQAAGHWSANLNETATVQIKPDATSDEAALVQMAQSAKDILLKSPNISGVDILPKAHSQALLRPWLGDAPLPDDLPLPTLLHVQLRPGQTLDVARLSSAFTAANLRVDIDNHAHWTKDLNRRARAAQLLAVFAFFLISVAISAACIFAIRAGITAQRKLMDVLHQIGAAPSYTARLFSSRFALGGFKAGCIGALGAFILLFLLSVFSETTGSDNYFIPGFAIGLQDVYLSILIPVFMALVSAVAAWHTVMKTLIAEMYS